MRRFPLVSSLLLFTAVTSLHAQTPEKPVSYGALPVGWQSNRSEDFSQGLLLLEFEGDFSRRETTSRSAYGDCYKTVDEGEGGAVIVRQRPDVIEMERFQSELYAGLMDNECDNNDSETCTISLKENSRSTFNGLPAQKLIYEVVKTYYKETVSCQVGMGTYHNTQDRAAPLVITSTIEGWLIPFGSIQFEIIAAGSSSNPSVLTDRMREIREFLGTFRFFGRSAEENSTQEGGDTGEGRSDGGGGTDPGSTGGGGTDDWTVGEVIIGAVAGAGAAVGIGLGIKAIAKGAGKAAGGGSKGGTPEKTPRQPARKPKRREEDEDSEEEEPEEREPEDEEEQHQKPARYVLQLSQTGFSLKTGEHADLQVTVWKISSDGSRIPAPDAVVTIRSHSAALRAEPDRGGANLSCRLHLASQPDTDKIPVEIHAQASGSAMRSRVEVSVARSQASYAFITTRMPPDKKELNPDGQDAMYLYVQVVNKADDHDPEVPRLNGRIRLANAGGDQGWMDPGQQTFIDGWQAIGFTARDPQPHLAGGGVPPKPPHQVSLEASVNLPDGQVLRQVFDFPLRQPAILDVDNDQLTFPAPPEHPSGAARPGTAQLDCIAFIEAPAPGERWTYTAAWEKGYPALTALEVIPRGADQAVIRLKSPTLALKPGQGSEYSRLIIRAESPKRKAFNERLVHVTLRGEGIFLVKGMTKGIFQVWGDPEKEKTKGEFAVYVWDEKEQTMVSDRRAAEKLIFDLQEANRDDKKALNLLSVAEFSPEYEHASGDGHGVWSFKVKNEIPGNEEVLPWTLRVRVRSFVTGRDYECDFPAGIYGAGIGPNSADWQREYDHCLVYIKRHVPEKYKPDMLRMVEERKMALGHEGLYHLRHKIHGITVNLILAEGAEGYREAEKWYTDMIEILEWAEWAGNLAFNVVASSVFGPYAPAVSMSKSYGIQALQYVLEGKNLEDWVYDTFSLYTLFKAGEGRLIDIDKIHDYFKGDGGMKSYAKAWAVFIAYHFAYNVFWEKKSVVEALKQVAREMRDEAIIMFFQKRLKAEAEKGKDGIELAPASISKLRNGMVARADGQNVVRVEDMLACMRDPRAMRSLKKASPELQDAFNRTREALYKQHDDAVKAKMAKELGLKPEDLKIDDFRTPGGAGSNINTDRDYRLLYKAGTDANGNDIWFEVPKEKWQDLSYQKFGELTGKPPGMSDTEWAQKHLQLATDKAHIEASPDYSDHAIDPKTGQKILIKPNIIAVEEGTSRLFDSTALGNMYHEKVHASLRMGQLSEAIAQCKKGVDTLNKVRHGYRIQNLDVGMLPGKLQEGMGIVKNAPVDLSATPEAMAKFNADLQRAGFRDLEDFSNKLATQFESLKQHDQSPASANLQRK